MTSGPIRSSAAITDFLNHALAVGSALAVRELEAKARAVGLLGERQRIQHAKAFKKAKKELGIQSIRNGFGSGGKWAWLMPPQAPQIAIASTWAINGGKLVELHRDWAVIERAQDRSRQVYHRRPLNAANVTLPWSSLQRVQKDG
jgi:hypothetical protein